MPTLLNNVQTFSTADGKTVRVIPPNSCAPFLVITSTNKSPLVYNGKRFGIVSSREISRILACFNACISKSENAEIKELTFAKAFEIYMLFLTSACIMKNKPAMLNHLFNYIQTQNIVPPRQLQLTVSRFLWSYIFIHYHYAMTGRTMGYHGEPTDEWRYGAKIQIPIQMLNKMPKHIINKTMTNEVIVRSDIPDYYSSIGNFIQEYTTHNKNIISEIALEIWKSTSDYAKNPILGKATFPKFRKGDFVQIRETSMHNMIHVYGFALFLTSETSDTPIHIGIDCKLPAFYLDVTGAPIKDYSPVFPVWTGTIQS